MINLYSRLKKFSVKPGINWIRKLGLKTKWMIITIFFVASLSYALVSFFIESGKKDLEKDLKAWGTSLIYNLEMSTKEAIVDKDYEKLNNFLLGIMIHQDMLYSAIFDEHGSLVAFYNTEHLFYLNIIEASLDQQFLQITEHQTITGEYFYNFVEPIRFVTLNKSPDSSQAHFDPLENAVAEIKRPASNPPDKIIGTIFLGISHKNMYTKLNKMRYRAIYITFVIALVIIVFVYLGVERITSPIKTLDQAALKVAQGDLGHSVKADRLDELGRLAKSFNEMIVKLKQSQEKEKLYTQMLEQQVSERTLELKISEQKYRTLFEHAGTAVVLLNIDGKFDMINKGFEILSGYAEKELNGRISFAEFLAADDCNKIKKLYDNNGSINKNPFPINHECTFIDRFENRKNINLTISLIPDTSKMLVSIVEVTELRDLQKRLTRTEQLATLGELSASIAHEIRNPLVAIHTSVGILKSALELNNEDQELMDIIAEESMRLNKIVDDFLKFARPNEPQVTSVNINNVIEDTLTVLRSRFNEKIEKNIHLSDEIPLASADPNQLKQVFMNMFINAIEAMPAGGKLDISTRYLNSRNTSPAIEVEIKDTGRGIDDHDLKKIFQPFYTNKLHGVGMGLAICERIIQNHGGQIKVTSVLGEGAQFNIMLPA